MNMTFTIFMEPVAKGRPRLGRGQYTYTPEATRLAEEDIKNQVIKQIDDNSYIGFGEKTPLRMTVVFYRTRPKTLAKKYTLPTSRPDLDNYIKTLEDALNGLAYHDDSQITSIRAEKRFGFPPRIIVKLEEDALSTTVS